jgi:hypothetical protein
MSNKHILTDLQNKIKDSQQGNSFSEDELEQYEKVKEEIYPFLSPFSFKVVVNASIFACNWNRSSRLV